MLKDKFLVFLGLLLLCSSVFAVDCDQTYSINPNESAFGYGQDCYELSIPSELLTFGDIEGQNELIVYSNLGGTVFELWKDSSKLCSAGFGEECRIEAGPAIYAIRIVNSGEYEFTTWVKAAALRVDRGTIVLPEYVPSFEPTKDQISSWIKKTDGEGNTITTLFNGNGAVLGVVEGGFDLENVSAWQDVEELGLARTDLDDFEFLERVSSTVNEEQFQTEMFLAGWAFEKAKSLPVNRIDYLSDLILSYYEINNLEEIGQEIYFKEKFSLAESWVLKQELNTEKEKVMPSCEELKSISVGFMDGFGFGLARHTPMGSGLDFSERTYFSAHYFPEEWFDSSKYSKALYACSVLKREFFDLKNYFLSKTRVSYRPEWDSSYSGFTSTESAKIMAANNPVSNGINWVSDSIMSFGSGIVGFGEEHFTPEWSKGIEEKSQKNWAVLAAASNPLAVVLPVNFKSKAYTGFRFVGGAIEGVGGLIKLPGMAGNLNGASIYFPSMHLEEEAEDTAAYFVEDFTIGLGADFVEEPARVGGQFAGAYLGLKGLGKLGKIKIGKASSVIESETSSAVSSKTVAEKPVKATGKSATAIEAIVESEMEIIIKNVGDISGTEKVISKYRYGNLLERIGAEKELRLANELKNQGKKIKSMRENVKTSKKSTDIDIELEDGTIYNVKSDFRLQTASKSPNAGAANKVYQSFAEELQKFLEYQESRGVNKPVIIDSDFPLSKDLINYLERLKKDGHNIELIERGGRS